MARALGDKQIRIMVGFGRPVFRIHLFGFPWLFNVVPFGGAMLPGPGTKLHRWKHSAVVAAGPMANLLILGITVALASRGRAHDGLGALLEFLFWANVSLLREV